MKPALCLAVAVWLFSPIAHSQAIEPSDPESQYALGLSYAKGEGVAQDDQQALRWFRLAAEQGHVEAQSTLGYMYANGEGVPKDYQQAINWYRSAAKQGDMLAQYNLGLMYVKGEGVPADEAEAIQWLRLAAKQGNVSAQNLVGLAYASGRGVPQDYSEAVKWLRLAAEQGDSESQFFLGRTYYNGEGVAKDYKEAAKWFRLAASQGDANSQVILGTMYIGAQGVPQDYVEALAWFSVAAASGSESGTKNRDLLSRSLTPEDLAAARERTASLLAEISARKVTSIPDAPISKSSHFTKIQLVPDLSIEIPSHWRVISQADSANLAALSEAIRQNSGTPEPEHEKTRLLAVNSVPSPSGATIRVNLISPDPLTQDYLENMPDADLVAIRDEVYKNMKALETQGGPEIISMAPAGIEEISNLKALVLSYERRGVGADVLPWHVSQYGIPTDEKTIQITLSYRLSDGAIWSPILERVKNSVIIEVSE